MVFTAPPCGAPENGFRLHPTCKPPQAPQIYVVASVRYSPSMRAEVTA